MKNLSMPIQITASETESRTITGRIVTFDEVAHASIGKTLFAQNSLKPKEVYLVAGHNKQAPTRIGRSIEMSMSQDGKGIDATFKIAETTAGNDILVLAAEKLIDGLSVEADIDEYITMRDGTIKVLAGELTAVAVVAEPAVRSARITAVAAEETLPEGEDSGSTPDTEETTNEGDEVDNTVTQAEAAPAVEAAQSVTAAATAVAGGYTTKPRIEVTAAAYMENTIKASLGDEDAKRYVLAADNTTDNAAFNPTPQMTTIINGLATMVRPSIDAISRGTLPSSGLTFEIPKITGLPSAAAADEDAAFSETDQASSFLSVTVKKFASQQKFSVELLTRSNPAFYDELYRNMVAQMAAAQDAYVNAGLITGATADATTITTYPTAAELLGFVSRGAASVYNATKGLPNPFATNLIANTSQWSNIMGLNVDGRPIYTAQQPQNAGGVASPRSLRGNVAGLDLYVTPNTAAGTDTDGSLIIVNPDAYTWYEDAANYQLRAESTADGSITVGLYSFGALATKIGAGAFKVNKA
jgi:phage head maturation protease